MPTSLRAALIWRGILAIVIGVGALVWPGITVGAFVILYAVYAFLAAVTDLMLAFSADRAGPVIGYVLQAVLSVAAAVLALVWPGVTALVLTLFVAAWAFTTGIVEITMSFRHGSRAGNRAIWALSGLVSIAFAVALFLHPDAGALALASVFGLFTLIYGATLLTVAAQLSSIERASTTPPGAP